MQNKSFYQFTTIRCDIIFRYEETLVQTDTTTLIPNLFLTSIALPIISTKQNLDKSHKKWDKSRTI